eukprot:PhM_4_TR14323/c0_g2_i1/m.93399
MAAAASAARSMAVDTTSSRILSHHNQCLLARLIPYPCPGMFTVGPVADKIRETMLDEQCEALFDAVVNPESVGAAPINPITTEPFLRAFSSVMDPRREAKTTQGELRTLFLVASARARREIDLIEDNPRQRLTAHQFYMAAEFWSRLFQVSNTPYLDACFTLDLFYGADVRRDDVISSPFAHLVNLAANRGPGFDFEKHALPIFNDEGSIAYQTIREVLQLERFLYGPYRNLLASKRHIFGPITPEMVNRTELWTVLFDRTKVDVLEKYFNAALMRKTIIQNRWEEVFMEFYPENDGMEGFVFTSPLDQRLAKRNNRNESIIDRPKCGAQPTFLGKEPVPSKRRFGAVGYYFKKYFPSGKDCALASSLPLYLAHDSPSRLRMWEKQKEEYLASRGKKNELKKEVVSAPEAGEQTAKTI